MYLPRLCFRAGILSNFLLFCIFQNKHASFLYQRNKKGIFYFFLREDELCQVIQVDLKGPIG